LSGLFDLDQRAGKILGVEEQHRLAVGADPGLAVAKRACAVRDYPVARGDDVGDVVADMVDAAVGIALDEFCDRRGL
jgi:hypothetical protein